MWDTQGLDYKITQEFILNEVKRLVEDGFKQGIQTLYFEVDLS